LNINVYATATEYVTNINFKGAGGLYNAVSAVDNGGTVVIDSALAGKTIKIIGTWTISKGCTIQGNGVIIDCSNHNIQTYGESPIFISRVHFTNGDNASNGGAIDNSTALTLHSCIFSNNKAYYGGAIHNTGNLTVAGCTFYNNKATGAGGAIYSMAEYNHSKTSTVLVGNLFYKNTAEYYGNVIFRYKGTLNSQYNAFDNTSYNSLTSTENSRENKYDLVGTGNKRVMSMPVVAASFYLSPNSKAIGMIDVIPKNYPAYDFYGKAMDTSPLAAGAVQSIQETN
jgi:predicted outer membrane repeat protein